MRIQRDMKSPCYDVGGSTREYSDRRPLMGERAEHFHHGAVAAECEDGVVLMRVLFGERGRMAGSFGLSDIASDAGLGKGLDRFSSDPRATPRGRIHDEQNAFDPPRRKFHRGGGTHFLLGSGFI